MEISSLPPPARLTELLARSAVIRTGRLILRRWREEDRAPFAALNADPRVMEFFPSPLTRAESDALIDRIEEGFGRNGLGLWALEVPGEAECIGFTGLSVPGLAIPTSGAAASSTRLVAGPPVEVGWRLASDFWGRGLATEAARAALAFGFGPAGLAEVISFTAAINLPSRRLMERLGMTRDPAADFDHPRLPPGHPLGPHVLYRIGPTCNEGEARFRAARDPGTAEKIRPIGEPFHPQGYRRSL